MTARVNWWREQLGPPEHDGAYADWLKTQSEPVQNAALGRRRAEAFRAGRIQIDRFVSPPGTLTREQLAARVPQKESE